MAILVSEVSESAGIDLPTSRQMIKCTHSSGQMVRLFVARRDCYTESQAFRRRCHGWNDRAGLVYRPLGARLDGMSQVPRSVVDIVAAQNVR